MGNDFDYSDMVDGNETEGNGMENQYGVNQYDQSQMQANMQYPQNGMQQPVNVKPVKMGKGKVLILCLVVIILLIFILVFIDGIGVKKNMGGTAQSDEAVNATNQSSQQVVENGGDVSSEIPDNSGVQGEGMSTSSENINNAENQGGVNEGIGTAENNELVQGEVVEEKEITEEQKAEFEDLTVEPQLGAEITVTGMVKGKSMYRVYNSYTYGINIVLITGDDNSVECTYFCPKKTADALAIGDSLNVIYTMDSVGNVCVVSISK